MNVEDVKYLFSDPANEGKVRNTWERFLNGEECRENALRRHVEDSWKRCIGANVDPGIVRAPDPLFGHSLESLQHLHMDLIDASRPIMLMASDFLTETGTVMALTDHHGVVLGVEGDTNALTAAEKIHFIPGATWKESTTGTNAVASAIALGQPVQIHAEEHFCEGIKRWTCSAAVIRDPIRGTVLGVIDVSGLSNSYSRHALSLVVTAAHRVESFLGKKEMEFRYRLIESSIPSFTAADGSGVILLDRHGLPIKLNEHAPALLTSLGFSLDINRPSRITGVSGRGQDIITEDESLPEWLNPDWIQPIFDKGERVGSSIRIPARYGKHRTRVGPGQEQRRSEFPGARGSSTELQQAIDKACQLARSRVPVLLLGETGVGKEVFARAIHEASKMRDGPFVALNCGGLSRDLLASELFGHVEGAFTGARRGGVAGKIEAAEGGTLFLDELGEMPLDLQPHFLRVLEDGCIYRVGDTTPRQVRFRLVAATNRDLRKEVAEGRFRMDLFYRVSVTSVRIPALRERRGDVAELAQEFLDQLTQVHEVGPKHLDPAALALLENYAWPGNVRELKNLIESLVLTVPGEVILASDLPEELQGEAVIASTTDGEVVTANLSRLARSEYEQICKMLRETGGNATLAAKQLGIAKSTLYLKLKKYDLDQSLDSWRSAN